MLIAEDEVLIAIYLEALVAGFGHQVCGVAASAREAIDNASAHALLSWIIRLADGTNGIDAAREIYLRHGLRCIFLSSDLDNATRRTLDPCKPIEFLDKPVLPVSLRRALEAAKRLIAR